MLQPKKFEDFHKEAKQFKSILLNYKKTGKPFVDNNFHPTLRIVETEVYIDDSMEKWVRVDKLYNAPLFQENLINSDFIQQGELGDCYLLSSFSRIAKQSYLIPTFFDTKTPNQILGRVQNSINLKCGAVVIYFNCFGYKTPVLIDTLLPLKNGQLRFSSPSDRNKSPWFCLLEKAYAKLYGSYSNIISGNIHQAIYNMLGYYPVSIDFQQMRDSEKVSNDQLFEKILKYHEKGAVMGTSISNLPNGVTKNEIIQKGLVTNHCYLVVKVQKASNMNFLCLRNPWGDHEWNGDWSDNSPLWTPELETELNVIKAEDGTFWMIDKDFFKYFTDLDVCKPFPEGTYSKRFFYQLIPGDHDGLHPSDEKANYPSKPNFVFRVTSPIKKGEKCRFHILVEKHHDLFDKRRNVRYSPPSYCIFTVRNNGSRINHKELPYLIRSTTRATMKLMYSSYDVSDNDDIITIALYRLQKCNIIEDCYVIVSCDREFDLFDIDNPLRPIKYFENPGIASNNEIIIKSKRNLPITTQNDLILQNEKKKSNENDNLETKNNDTINNKNDDVVNNRNNNEMKVINDLKLKQQEEIKAKDQEIKRMNEKMKEEIRARMKAEEDAKNANAEIEHLKSLLQKAQNQIREREIEDSKNDKLQQELNQKLNEVNLMKKQVEEEKKMVNIEKQKIQSERNKNHHHRHHRHHRQMNEEINNEVDESNKSKLPNQSNELNSMQEYINQSQSNEPNKRQIIKEETNETIDPNQVTNNDKNSASYDLSEKNKLKEIKDKDKNSTSPESSTRNNLKRIKDNDKNPISHESSTRNNLKEIKDNDKNSTSHELSTRNNLKEIKDNDKNSTSHELSASNKLGEIKDNKDSNSSHRKKQKQSTNQTKESPIKSPSIKSSVSHAKVRPVNLSRNLCNIESLVLNDSLRKRRQSPVNSRLMPTYLSINPYRNNRKTKSNATKNKPKSRSKSAPKKKYV